MVSSGLAYARLSYRLAILFPDGAVLLVISMIRLRQSINLLNARSQSGPVGSRPSPSPVTPVDLEELRRVSETVLHSRPDNRHVYDVLRVSIIPSETEVCKMYTV